MKNIIYIGLFLAVLLGCTSSKTDPNKFSENNNAVQNDTVRIANDELEYEVIIIDSGFNSWLASRAKPRNYYSQSYLEARNRIWVLEWNNRVIQGNPLFDMQIDYQSHINYGYEVNYLLYNYLTYFQLTNNIRLGGFAPRI